MEPRRRPDGGPNGRVSRRGVARDSFALLVGTAANGILAYAFFALATRALGAADAAPVAQLWTLWSASAAVLTFPVQHWIIRTMQADGDAAAVRAALPRVTLLISGAAAAVAAVSWLAREQLFLTGGAIFPLLAGAVTVGAFFVGLVRGRLAGVRRFVATGAVIAAENLLRVVLAAVVIVGGGGAVGFGVALALGGLAALAWPSAYRFSDVRDAPAATDGSPLAFLGGVAAGSLIAQLVLTGGPVVLATIGGAAEEVTALFIALALFRAPYLVTLGLVTQVTGALTNLISTGRERTLRRVRHGLAAAAVVGALAVGALGWSLGPLLITLVFGAGTSPPRAVVAVVAAATAIALANLVFTVLLVARGTSGALTTNWVAAVAVGAAALVVPVPPLARVAGAFLAAEVTALALMWWTEQRAARRVGVSGPAPAPSDRDAASRRPA
ncbi:MAG TPA: hypothetical protein VFZ70_14195 [Euzebyales bacterium]